MAQKMSTKLSSLNIKLERIINSRDKDPSTRQILHNQVQMFLLIAKEIASTVNFAITIVFISDRSLEQSWDMLETRLNFVQSFLKQFPVYSVLIGIEIHKAGHHKKVSKSKNTSFSKNSRSNLAGRPHFRIHLTLYNNFLCPSATEIHDLFMDHPLTTLEDISVKKLPPDNPEKARFDCKNWFMYCTKELSDSKTQKFLFETVGLKSSCILF